MIKFKDDSDMKLFFLMHPIMQMIITDGSFWAYQRGIDLVLTETVTTLKQDEALSRKSSSHRQKRAADIRTKNWSVKNRSEFDKYLTKKFGEYGALSFSGFKNLVVFHDSGHGEHFHIQIHSKYSL